HRTCRTRLTSTGSPADHFDIDRDTTLRENIHSAALALTAHARDGVMFLISGAPQEFVVTDTGRANSRGRRTTFRDLRRTTSRSRSRGQKSRSHSRAKICVSGRQRTRSASSTSSSCGSINSPSSNLFTSSRKKWRKLKFREMRHPKREFKMLSHGSRKKHLRKRSPSRFRRYHHFCRNGLFTAGFGCRCGESSPDRSQQSHDR
ncbi:hypothetical protein Tcan_00625, partial [Toxocara canis]